MSKAEQWGMRCVHEAKCWPQSHFVTLTYNDEFMPPGGSLCLRDVQLFMKRLRFEYKSTSASPIRFFLGGEYGDENRRPHYHALLFNLSLDDRMYYATNKRGEKLFTSARLAACWGKGFVTIGAVTLDSAIYCAKYALKALNVTDDSPPEVRRRYEERYVVYDADGVVTERCREFAVMSRRPGIGGYYYEKYGAEVRAHDSVVVNGKERSPPRYYDSKFDAVDADGFARMKRKRKRLAVLAKSDNTPERLRVKERLMVIAAELKERKL
ncbi:MAG: replication initiator protein [Microviridae sp.]|nr:MAG: replication initiator protein [Microviridae sp.]